LNESVQDVSSKKSAAEPSTKYVQNLKVNLEKQE